MNRCFVLLAVFVLFGNSLCAHTVELPAIADATIYSESHLWNNGGGPTSYSGLTHTEGRRRLLLNFDLSSVPPGSIIEAVTLTLHMSASTTGSMNSQLNLHRIVTLGYASDWCEGYGTGNVDEAEFTYGGVTYQTRCHAGSPRSYWARSGGDFADEPSASVDVGNTTGPKSWGGSGLVADVAAWKNHQLPANGWILIGDETVPGSVREFVSSESTSTLQLPSLTITYTPPFAARVDQVWWKQYNSGWAYWLVGTWWQGTNYFAAYGWMPAFGYKWPKTWHWFDALGFAWFYDWDAGYWTTLSDKQQRL